MFPKQTSCVPKGLLSVLGKDVATANLKARQPNPSWEPQPESARGAVALPLSRQLKTGGDEVPRPRRSAKP